MTIEKKLLGTSPSGGATDVADVFSTHLYKGNATARAITNGIDLAGEGGLVWSKNRDLGEDHCLTDTVKGAGNYLLSSGNNAQQTDGNIASFNSTGYSLTGNGRGNYNNSDYASWTFRKKEKFFTCLTFTGNGQNNQTISHSLGSIPAMILIKRTNGTSDWITYNSTGSAYKQMVLNTTAGNNSDKDFDQIATDSTLKVGHIGGSTGVGANGQTCIAYLFADNSSEDAEDQMIKCGSFTTDGSGNATIDLGWEPQFVITKKTNGTSDWNIWDTMRGWNLSSYDYLRANAAGAETGNANYGNPTATGFTSNGVIGYNSSGIYMAIRAPMMVEPEAATDVFAVSTEAAFSSDRLVSAGFAVDATISSQTGTSGASHMTNRLTAGTWLSPDETSAQGTGAYWLYDESEGVKGTNTQYGSVTTVWNMWKRAKGFMDCVAYTGSSSAGNLTINHSLGVAPELIISKSRSNVQAWSVLFNMEASSYQYFTTLGTAPDYASGRSYGSGYLASKPTDTAYVIKTDTGIGSGNNYIAYLFATLAGISKVGSYTGNGSNQTINCGFSAGSRFILIKRVNNSGDWYFWDSVRGIVAGNDPHLSLNTTAAQVTSDDSIDPHNSGFIVNQVSATNINVSSEEYLFYAIA